MKPRTKTQKEIAQLVKLIPPINQARENWVYRKVLYEPSALYSGKSAWCSECGQSFELGKCSHKQVKCPHCNTTLMVKKTKCRKDKGQAYFTVIDAFHNYQVIRHFFANKYYRKGQASWMDYDEVIQIWINEKGKQTIVARQSLMDCWSDMPFSLNSDLEIRQKYSGWVLRDKYNICASYICPYYSLTKKVRRNGFTLRVQASPQEYITALLSKTSTETLTKTKQYALAAKSVEGLEEKFVKAAYICTRHHYIVKDATLWVDYLRYMDELGKDLHNPTNLCPKSLISAHSKAQQQVQKKRSEENRKKRLLEARKYEEQYFKEKNKYFGICFGNEVIKISVFKSVADIAEEGAAMHHCVYDMGYYKKPYSLIMAARDKDGNRIETIEVDLKQYRIVQSRAVCNGSSEYHQKIIDLVNKNMDLIRKVKSA